MQTPARSPGSTQHLMALLAGVIAAAAIWLIGGAPDSAWLGFVLAAVAAEPRGRRACHPRVTWRSRA